MITIDEIRKQFPMYSDVSDTDLVRAVRKKFYPDIPIGEFVKQVTWKGPDPTEGMSGPEKFWAGTQKAFYDLWLGGRQMLGNASQEEVDAARERDAPLMRHGAAVAGNVVGNAVPAVVASAVPGANTLLGSAAIGATLNALQPLKADQNRLQQAAIGAGLGFASQAGANAIGRALKPVQAVPTAAESDLIRKAGNLGVNLNAAQQTGSKPLRWIDSALDNLPFTADKQAAAKLAQREAWQSAVLKQVGENADNATPDVLGAAYTRLGDQFRQLSSRNQVKLGDEFLDAIVAVDSSKTPFSKGIDGIVRKALDLASKGDISGAEYQAVRSSLTQASKGAWASNPQLGQALKSLRGALDDAAEASMPAADKAAWQAVRKQYAALKTVEKATDSATGTISPKKLFNELQRANPQGMRYGFGNQEMPDIARVGKAFIADTLPDSGTAQRAWYMNALQSPWGVLGGLGLISGGAPGAVLGAAAGAGVPLAAQRALWSGGRYLTKGLLDPEIAGSVVRPALIGSGVGLLPQLSE